MKQLHGEINAANEPENEIGKFSWLRDNGIITDEEYHEALEKLKMRSVQDVLH